MLLQLLSQIYAGVIAARNALYDRSSLQSYFSALPVFCVGNAIVGGSGKSPFTHLLVEQLVSLGYSPAILMRGYRGKESGPYLVQKGDSIVKVGDEALMHFQHFDGGVPIVVSKKRVSGCIFIEEAKLADCIVLDDGYQHRSLERDINFLLLDVSNPKSRQTWEQGSMLPHGRLREPLEDALKRANAVVYTSRSASAPAPQTGTLKSETFTHLPELHFDLFPDALVDLHSDERIPLSSVTPFEARAVSAIANPESFFDILRTLGFNLISKHPFPDHHTVTGPEWVSLLDNKNVPVISTSKDASKIKKFATQPGRVFVLELNGQLRSDAEYKTLVELLNAGLNKNEWKMTQSQTTKLVQ
jgi:tetraacyldisaccharide 4'-kinase